MDKKQFVQDELMALGTYFLSVGYYFRLVMTDDIDNMSIIRDRAREKKSHAAKKEWGEDFYHGLALSPEHQTRVDTLIRDYKPELLALVKGETTLHDAVAIEVIPDPEQKAYLVIFSTSGMGFFVSDRIHKPRELRVRRTTMSDVKHQALQAPQEPSTGRRRKFVTIRRIVN
ncbi:hypothetical protein D3C76_376140 [compost metagenome]